MSIQLLAYPQLNCIKRNLGYLFQQKFASKRPECKLEMCFISIETNGQNNLFSVNNLWEVFI